ncbi:MAG: hypothetical protein QXO47_10460, partial [Thermoproteota archaeon]
MVCLAESRSVVWGERLETMLPYGKTAETISVPSPLTDAPGFSKCIEELKGEVDLIVALWDAFALRPLNGAQIPYLAYIPVDTQMTQSWASNVWAASRIIAMSRYGYSEIRKWFPASMSSYIPHGVDVETFKPGAGDRSKVKCFPPLSEDEYLFTCVATNTDRKRLPVLLEAFDSLCDRTPSIRVGLYLHTNVTATQFGYY